LAMILPVLSLPKDSVVITVSPLRLIQDNHVAEFTKYGIRSIAINCFTPEDEKLWKSIRSHSAYQHYSVSPEQCGPYQGHIPHFAKLLHDPKWAQRVKLLQIDEAHFIATAGQSKGKEAAFRPSFSDLGERLRVHLPATTPCTAYSASMPPQIMNLVTSTLRMEPYKTVKIELTTNRPNLVYAVIPMVGSIDNFANLDFLWPDSFPPNFILRQKSIVFIDHKRKAARLAEYLNAKVPHDLAAKKPFRHYHSSMSKPYLEEIARSFKDPDGDGFDVTDIDLIVEFGVPKTVIDDDQQAGRGGRDERECLVLMIAERWAYDALAQSNPEHKPSNKEKRTEPAVISNASSRKDCRRRGLAKHNNDTTPDAHHFSGKWCCDNHTDNFDFNQYLLGTILTEAHDSDADLPAKKPRRKYRPVPQRDPVIHSLEAWRASIHAGDPVAQNFPISYILDDTAIEHLAREVSGFFRLPSNVTEFLGETTEWHSRHALDVVTIIRQHDLSAPQRRRNVNSASISDSEASDSEYS
ncbi:P-loop containing nucleoside triphosphate hydrolase protein, partial [Mycena galopus ATCC 62051]